MKLLWFLFCNIFGNKVDLYRTFGEALNELKQQNFLINCNDRYKDTLMYEMEVRTVNTCWPLSNAWIHAPPGSTHRSGSTDQTGSLGPRGSTFRSVDPWSNGQSSQSIYFQCGGRINPEVEALKSALDWISNQTWWKIHSRPMLRKWNSCEHFWNQQSLGIHP